MLVSDLTYRMFLLMRAMMLCVRERQLPATELLAAAAETRSCWALEIDVEVCCVASGVRVPCPSSSLVLPPPSQGNGEVPLLCLLSDSGRWGRLGWDSPCAGDAASCSGPTSTSSIQGTWASHIWVAAPVVWS
jgi:hypothetical protein